MTTCPRRTFAAVLLAFCILPLGAQTAAPDVSRADPTMAANKNVAADVVWHDATTWGAEGRAWPEQERERWFDRLPAAAEKTVTKNVLESQPRLGGHGRAFRDGRDVDSRSLPAPQAPLAMPHMPATGASGVDLYARDAAGKWRWVQVTRPAAQEVKTEIAKDLAPGLREYAAYLPLYNGVESLAIGVPQGAKFEGLAPRAAKPIVFYGTSITHGACASRPGMVHTAILGRRFDRPVVNLGFSGNGRMDTAVGEFLKQIDAAVFVIDCLPNMQPKDVAAKTAPLVRQLRAARPDTPIVLVEDRRFTNDWITPAKAKFHDDNHAALKAAFEALHSEGVKSLFYIPGDALYGTDGEGATDASHASDLGFMRQADAMEPVLRAALTKS